MCSRLRKGTQLYEQKLLRCAIFPFQFLPYGRETPDSLRSWDTRSADHPSTTEGTMKLLSSVGPAAFTRIPFFRQLCAMERFTPTHRSLRMTSCSVKVVLLEQRRLMVIFPGGSKIGQCSRREGLTTETFRRP